MARTKRYVAVVKTRWSLLEVSLQIWLPKNFLYTVSPCGFVSAIPPGSVFILMTDFRLLFSIILSSNPFHLNCVAEPFCVLNLSVAGSKG